MSRHVSAEIQAFRFASRGVGFGTALRRAAKRVSVREILEYDECVCKIFELAKLIPPLRRNDEAYYEAVEDTMDMPNKEDIILKAIKEGPTTAIQE